MIYYGGKCSECGGPADMDNSDLFIEPGENIIYMRIVHKNRATCADERNESNRPGGVDQRPDNGAGYL